MLHLGGVGAGSLAKALAGFWHPNGLGTCLPHGSRPRTIGGLPSEWWSRERQRMAAS